VQNLKTEVESLNKLMSQAASQRKTLEDITNYNFQLIEKNKQLTSINSNLKKTQAKLESDVKTISEQIEREKKLLESSQRVALASADA
jgi:hypothetical protein